MSRYDPHRDLRCPAMDDMAGRVVVVTGANTGIGKATARALAARGASVVLACRSEEKALPVVDELRAATGNDDITFHQLDLGDLTAVKLSAAAYLEAGRPIHVLVN